MKPILVIDTGSANTRSVDTALRRVGLEPDVVRSPVQITDAARLVLPGVGAFGGAMASLHEQGLIDALRDRLRAGRPTLAVCIGLQLLCETSAEAEGVAGLGVLPASVGRFDAAVRVPHMGWNRLHSDIDLLESGHAYFANSYRVDGNAIEAIAADGWQVARCDWGGDFVAAVRREGVLACQFHPELSGTLGLSMLRRWAESTEEVAAC